VSGNKETLSNVRNKHKSLHGSHHFTGGLTNHQLSPISTVLKYRSSIREPTIMFAGLVDLSGRFEGVSGACGILNQVGPQFFAQP
jgi:hypothetical protein